MEVCTSESAPTAEFRTSSKIAARKKPHKYLLQISRLSSDEETAISKQNNPWSTASSQCFHKWVYAENMRQNQTKFLDSFKYEQNFAIFAAVVPDSSY